MRSEWVEQDTMRLILAAMMPANGLAIEVSLYTGLRIDDVLSLKTAAVQRSARPYVRDSKTGKLHRIYLPAELRERMLAQAGRVWVWEHRLDWRRHRTRQAVYKDMRQAAAVYERTGRLRAHISPHSARKVAAVRAYKRGGLEAAQALLVHDTGHPLVTLVYALADQDGGGAASARRQKRRSGSRTRGRKGTRGQCRRADAGEPGGNPRKDRR